MPYLNKEDDEEIEVGYSSELLKQILGDKVPYCVLENKENDIQHHYREEIFK